MDSNNYLESVRKQFTQMKVMGEKAMDQVPANKLFWQYNAETNSIGIIVKHIAGNMMSRFTDFFTTDGEKPWRDRDAEFENEVLTQDNLLTLWNKGWDCLFGVLNGLKDEDLHKKVLIRNEQHTVVDALNRQLAHYASHIGQIIYIGKMIVGGDWKTLTIPRKGSKEFNAKMGL
jgi:hypothetical protein